MAIRRTTAQVEADRTEIGRLYLENLSVLEIANRLELSIAAVQKDLKVLRAQWRADGEKDRADLLGNEIARLSNLERVAWEAWHASRTPRKTQTSTMQEAEEAIKEALGRPSKVRSVLKSETRDGNPVILKLIFDCIRQRCLLYGLAPKDSVDSVVIEQVEVEFEKLMQQMNQILPEDVKPIFFEAASTAVEALAASTAGK